MTYDVRSESVRAAEWESWIRSSTLGCSTDATHPESSKLLSWKNGAITAIGIPYCAECAVEAVRQGRRGLQVDEFTPEIKEFRLEAARN